MTATGPPPPVDCAATVALDREHPHGAVVMGDLAGRVSYVNPAWLAMWGFGDASQVIGRDSLDFWVDPEVVRAVREQVRREGAWQGGALARRADGRAMAVWCSIRLVHDATGQPAGYMASYVDRSAELQALQAAEAERQFSEAIIGAAGVLVLVLDEQGRFVRFNKACEQASGRRADEVLGLHPWQTVLPPEAVDAVRVGAFERAFAAPPGEVLRHTNQWLRRDGGRRLIEWSNSVIRGPDGQRRFLVSIGVDITERQAAQAALSLSESRLRRAQKVAQLGYWELDLRSQAMHWSDEVYRIFEVDPARFQPTYERVLDCVHPDDRAEVDQVFRSSRRERRPFVVRHRLRLDDGRTKWVEERGEYLVGDGGRELRSVGTVQDVSAAHQREIELERFRFMLEESSVEVWLIDSAWRIRFANRAAALSVDHPVEQLLTMKMADIDEGGAERLGRVHESVVASIQRGQAPPSFETVHRTRSGARVHKEVRPTVVHFDGEPFVCAFAQDIGERRRIQATLQARERQLADALDAFPGVVAGVDDELRYVYVNQRFCQEVGRPRQDIVGHGVATVKPADELRLREINRRLLRGERVSIERRMADRQGAEHVYTIDYRLTFDPSGPGQHVFHAFATDITELRREQTRLRATIDGTRTGTWEWRPGIGQLTLNHWLALLVGARPGDAPPDWAERLVETIHPDDLPLRQARLRDHLAGRSAVFECETRVRHRDGGWICVLERGQVVERDPAGRVSLMLGTSQDVTELKRKEDELRVLAGELERRVVERTQQLEQAKALAERASEAKTEFLSRMSHELRTPLNAILGFAQVLELGSLGDDDAQSVREIARAGQHLAVLIDDVLDLSTVEAGRVRLDLHDTMLAPLVEACVTLMRPAAQAAGLSLSGGPIRAGTSVRADPRRLQQVLLNLLSNAVKYTPPGGRVSVQVPEGDAATVAIDVADTGVGVPADQVDRLFMPFERLAVHEGRVAGTGIGLSVSKQLVELMHGSIEVRSEPGCGSTFRVRLPRSEGPGAVVEPGAVQPRPDDAPLGPTRRVLYVEDNAANLHLMQRILERRPDIQLSTAGDACQGLAAVLLTRPALVLVDIQLPGAGDGYELLRRMRGSGLSMPVVAVSANAMAADVQRGLSAGFADYLTKPLDLRRVLEVVDRLAVAAEPGEEQGDPTPARRVAAQRSADRDPRAAAACPDPAVGGSGRAGA